MTESQLALSQLLPSQRSGLSLKSSQFPYVRTDTWSHTDRYRFSRILCISCPYVAFVDTKLISAHAFHVRTCISHHSCSNQALKKSCTIRSCVWEGWFLFGKRIGMLLLSGLNSCRLQWSNVQMVLSRGGLTLGCFWVC